MRLPARYFSAFLCVLVFTASAAAQVRQPLPKRPYGKLQSALGSLVLAMDAGQPLAAAVAALHNPLVRGTTVPVSIRTDDVQAVLSLLRASRATVANASDDVVEAYVTPQVMRQLNGLGGVRLVTQIVAPQASEVTQGAAVHNATHWHTNGYTGAGVKVGIIDVSFDGFAALMGTELPAVVTARCYTGVGTYSNSIPACALGSPHGTAVAESLMDVAPGVQLYIATPFSYLDFRQTVDWMTSQGVTIMNFSAGTLWDGPGDGSSPYSDSPLRTVDAAVSNGAMFAMAAGNHGASTYLGAFVDSNADLWAEFPSGVDDNSVFLSAGETVRIQLRWQDTWVGSTRDLDLGLFNSAYVLQESSTDIQDGHPTSRPFEFLSFTAPSAGIYYIGVRWFDGAVPAWIQLQTFSQQPLGYTTSTGSISSPAETANSGALAVGAASWSSTSTIESFSSRGPTPDGRVKPDIVGADRGNTVSYGVGAFAGTSQSSPHVAGLAALLKQAVPSFTPLQVANYLKTNAAARGTGRPNNVWGYGFAMLPNICSFTITPASATFSAAAGTRTVAVTASAGDCAWTAASNSAHITVTGGASGMGSGTVTYAVAANGSTNGRAGSLTVAGHTLTVTQLGVMTPPWDLDGDGMADLLWRHSQTGDVSAWLMNGTVLKDAVVLWEDVPLAWQIQAVRDLDGDRRADLIWRNTQSGDVSVWLMNGTVIKDSAVLWAGVPLAWQIVGVDDVNADGRSDLFWRNTQTGDVSVWLMNGTTISQAVVVWEDVPLEWEIVGMGDVGGDGKADLFWRHSITGDVSVWLMDGLTVTQAQVLWEDVPLEWEIQAVRDLNADGSADLLWRNATTGDVSAWLMNGTAIAEAEIVWEDVPLVWQITAVRDIDGDGRADLIWRQTQSGDVSAWMMNGTTVMQAVVLWPGVPLQWQIQ